MQCPYCGNEVEFTTNDKIYGRKYGNGMVYLCQPCDAYVGCHADGTPLGTPAKKELRDKRHRAHEAFDPLWKNAKDKGKKRQSVYGALSEFMNIPRSDTHIGMFNLEQCEKVFEFVKTRRRNLTTVTGETRTLTVIKLSVKSKIIHALEALKTMLHKKE